MTNQVENQDKLKSAGALGALSMKESTPVPRHCTAWSEIRRMKSTENPPDAIIVRKRQGCNIL